VARHGLFLQDVVAFVHTVTVGRRRIRIAIEDAGVKLGAVFAGQFGRARAVARVVSDGFQTLHVGLVRLDLLFFHSKVACEGILFKLTPCKSKLF